MQVITKHISLLSDQTQTVRVTMRTTGGQSAYHPNAFATATTKMDSHYDKA